MFNKELKDAYPQERKDAVRKAFLGKLKETLQTIISPKPDVVYAGIEGHIEPEGEGTANRVEKLRGPPRRGLRRSAGGVQYHSGSIIASSLRKSRYVDLRGITLDALLYHFAML